MFRQEEVCFGGWHEKTIEAMQRRRFEQMVSMLPPLGSERLAELNPDAFKRRIEQCWQNIERKPMRSQQLNEVWKCVLGSVDAQADCLSIEEHELVERALILGGSARIEDVLELEAAHALSKRLWANVGVISGRPYIELERQVMRPVARAFARQEHEMIRRRLDAFNIQLTNVLYRAGVLDDRLPHQYMIKEIFGETDNETIVQLSRRYLWASFDCIDYADGVMLIHPALADPQRLIGTQTRKHSMSIFYLKKQWIEHADILPEEIPLQSRLECLISGAVRAGQSPQDTARTMRFLCKQGAPIAALEEVLQSSLIVCLSPAMRSAIRDMYYMTPKWIENAAADSFQ